MCHCARNVKTHLIDRRLVVLFLALVFAPVTISQQRAFADQVTVTKGVVQDTYVIKDENTLCFGNESMVAVGEHTDVEALIEFSLADIPDGATINSAKLKLYIANDYSSGGFGIAKVRDYWQASLPCVKWSNRPGWQTPVVSAPAIGGSNKWVEVEVKDIVARWVTYGAVNRGFYLEAYSGWFQFWSKENEYAKRPKLVITYTYTVPTFSASGRVLDYASQGVQATMHFDLTSGSGSTPSDVMCDAAGHWEQTGFTSGATYRVTPHASQCGEQFGFVPDHRDFGDGTSSALDFTAIPPCPSPPGNFTATPGTEAGSVRLHWTEPCGALGYVVHYDDDSSGAWDPSPNGSPNSGDGPEYNTDNLVISGLTPGQPYRVQLAATNACGIGEWTEVQWVYARAIAVMTIVPPFQSASTSYDFNEVTGIGLRSIGVLPSGLNPVSGQVNQTAGIVLYGIGGSVLEANTKLNVPISVPLSGNYRVNAYGTASCNIYAGHTGILQLIGVPISGIGDIKHGLWIGIELDGSPRDFQTLRNTLPEGFTSGIGELALDATEAICDVLTGGTCLALTYQLTQAKLTELEYNLATLSDGIQCTGGNVLLGFDVQLQANRTYVISPFLRSANAGGVSAQFGASTTYITLELDSISLQQMSGDMGPMMQVSPSNIVQLPATEIGQTASNARVFTIHNVGDHTLNCTVIIDQGPFSLLSSSGPVIQPHDSSAVALSFNPDSSESFTKTVVFSAAGHPSIERLVTATGIESTPILRVWPSGEDTIRFGDLAVNSSDTTTGLIVFNDGSGILQGEVTVDAPFSVVESGTFQLEHGQSKTYRIGFSPTLPLDTTYIKILRISADVIDSVVVTGSTTATDVQDIKTSQLPDSYSLMQNYPNPFNPATFIDFALPRPAHVKIEVVNSLGQVVRLLVDEYLSAGVKRVEWDGTDSGGKSVASGIYFYKLTAPGFTDAKKMILLR